MKTANFSGRQGEGVVPGQAETLMQHHSEQGEAMISAAGAKAVDNALHAVLLANKHRIEPRLWLRFSMTECPRSGEGTYTTILMHATNAEVRAWHDEDEMHRLDIGTEGVAKTGTVLANIILRSSELEPVRVCSSTPDEQNTAVKAISFASKIVLGKAGHDLNVALRYTRQPVNRADRPEIELIVIPVKHRS